MLVHQHQTSEGSVSDSVKLTNRTVFRDRTGAQCHSGIQTNASGVLNLVQNNGGLSAVSGEWLLTGSAAGFWIQRTINSGTLETDPGAGFLQMNTSRLYENIQTGSGLKTTEVFFEISSDISGVPVVETATHTYHSEQNA